MALVRKKKAGKEGRPLAEEVTGANLYADDLSKLLEYVRAGEGQKADVLRTLVSEAIEAREGDRVSLDKISNQTGDNLGLNFEALKLLEGIFAMLLNDVTKPRLLKRFNDDSARVEETVEQMSGRFEQRAVEKVERVRKEVRGGTKAAS